MQDIQKKRSTGTISEEPASSFSSFTAQTASRQPLAYNSSSLPAILREPSKNRTYQHGLLAGQVTNEVPVNHDDSVVFVISGKSTNAETFLIQDELEFAPGRQKCSICGHVQSRSSQENRFSTLELKFLRSTGMVRNLAQIGAGRSDPFNVLPVQMTGIQPELVDHCEIFLCQCR
jgi:hypothetical protein